MPKPEKGKIKIRFFEVELEGSDETLLESVRSAAALANRANNSRPIKQLGPIKSNNGDDAVGAAPATEQEEEDVLDVGEPQEAGSAKGKKSRVYRTPKILNIDLTSGPLPFATFVASKKPN